MYNDITKTNSNKEQITMTNVTISFDMHILSFITNKANIEWNRNLKIFQLL